MPDVRLALFAEDMLFWGCFRVSFSSLFGPLNALCEVFGWLWACLEAQKLIFEGLALTLEVHGVTLAVFELQFSSPWGHLGSCGIDFGVSWISKG